MIKDFNLLATTSRGFGRATCRELKYLLEQIGDNTAIVDKTGIAGLVVAKTSIDPFEAVKKLKEVLRDRPYEFRYLFRVIPVERVVRTDLAEIEKAVVELSGKIREGECFRITVEKRFTSLSSHAVIEAVAKSIKRQVNLDKPDKIVLIEIVGGLTGISVLTPNDLISVLKEKLL
jgi:tRNA acetyltransferase TAN1